MKIVRESLFEDVIDNDVLEIDIDYGISRSEHAEKRQGRDGEDYISNEEIADNVKAALATITKDLIFDTIDIGDRILIKNTSYSLII